MGDIRDGRTNFTLRIKEQTKRLTLHEHDDDDDDAKNLVPISQRTQFVSNRLMLIMKTMCICYGTQSPLSTEHKGTAWASRSTLSLKVGGTQEYSQSLTGFKIISDQSISRVSDKHNIIMYQEFGPDIFLSFHEGNEG
jgi:hypothetical protein